MKSYRIVLSLSLLVLATGLAFFLGDRGAARAGGEARIALTDGRTFEGRLFRLREGAWVLQNARTSLLVEQDEIRSIDGEAFPSLPGTPVRRFEEPFDEVQADGSVLVRSRLRWKHRGGEPLREVSWGLAPHEMGYLQDYRIFDPWGHRLDYRVEERKKGGATVRVPLQRPVLPGEELDLTVVLRQPDRIHQAQDRKVYVHAGDYPDERLVSRAVLLPEGAEILRVSPDPVERLERDGRPLVIWRRWYVAGEDAPLRIEYRL